ncbi:MAG TPA: Hsp20/alpha crystallin family protein [Blastocatellia bacterium]|nr:Hsp20/alpha crystallin family protein [Blastocatellia bacterium]
MATQIATLNQLLNRTGFPANRLFKEFFSLPWNPGEDLGLTAASPSFDVIESDDKYMVKADLPGFEKNNINLTYENRTLTLSGERKLEEAEGMRYHRVESFSGKFTRSVTLPVEIDVNKITADLSNGVLTVTLPKAESVRPKQISVNIG